MTHPEAMGVEPCQHVFDGEFCALCGEDRMVVLVERELASPAVDGLDVVERLRALADTPAGTGYADAVMNVYAELPVRQFFSDLLALSTQVQRLTEQNEALRKDAGELVVAQYALSAAVARIKALEEALTNALACGLPEVVAAAARSTLQKEQADG